MKKITKQQLMDFEERIRKLWLTATVPFPIHFCGGNENELIEIFKNINEEDYIFSTWRAHYHYLLKGGDSEKLFEMITINAQKALMLDESLGVLNNQTANLLLLPKKVEDPFENLLHCDINDIELFIYNGIPLYGNTRFLDNFDLDLKNYYQFGNKFVIGHPEKILATIKAKLGYKKSFPFLPI